MPQRVGAAAVVERRDREGRREPDGDVHAGKHHEEQTDKHGDGVREACDQHRDVPLADRRGDGAEPARPKRKVVGDERERNAERERCGEERERAPEQRDVAESAGGQEHADKHRMLADADGRPGHESAHAEALDTVDRLRGRGCGHVIPPYSDAARSRRANGHPRTGRAFDSASDGERTAEYRPVVCRLRY
jgi:hypothetical protein